MPHDLQIVYEDDRLKCEVCNICNKKFRWNKCYKGRIDNKRYLEAHIRNFCQRFGATKRVYYKVYKKDECKIVI